MILVIAGMSCAGKDAMQNELMKLGWNSIVSTTSRPKRIGEVEGINYYYKTKKEFHQLINDDKLIEYRVYHTLVDNNPDDWYYGVEKDKVNLNKRTVVVLDSVGYTEFVKNFGKDNVKLLWMEAPTEIRKKRNIDRLDYNESEFKRRETEDTKSFGNLKSEANFVYENTSTYDDLIKFANKINNEAR